MFSCFLLLFLSTLAIAEDCASKYGSKFVPMPLLTDYIGSTITLKSTTTVTTTPVTTVTNDPITLPVEDKSTSTIQITISTTTTTTLTSTSGSTISASGFVPLASILTAGSRSPSEHDTQQSNNAHPVLPRRVRFFPQRVICTTLTTIIMTKTKTRTASKQTFTTNTTAIESEFAFVTNTVIISITNTNTIVSTSTQTTILPAPTPLIAMCQNDNMQPMNAGVSSGPNGWSYSNATDAMDCCMQCYRAESGCSSFSYYLGPGPIPDTGTEPATCRFNVPDDMECNPQRAVGSLGTGDFVDHRWIVGNSFCGRLERP